MHTDLFFNGETDRHVSVDYDYENPGDRGRIYLGKYVGGVTLYLDAAQLRELADKIYAALRAESSEEIEAATDDEATSVATTVVTVKGGQYLIRPGADLTEANLYGADLREAILRGADLREADLRGAYFYRANLDGAHLREANLDGANLDEAHLRGADLREAHLRGAYFYRADLREANLTEADLYGADLREADLREADLRGAYFYRADLDGAHLDGARNLDVAYGLDQAIGEPASLPDGWRFDGEHITPSVDE
jgi:hypothetical protein